MNMVARQMISERLHQLLSVINKQKFLESKEILVAEEGTRRRTPDTRISAMIPAALTTSSYSADSVSCNWSLVRVYAAICGERSSYLEGQR